MIIKNVALETVCGITSTLPENTKPEFAFAGKSNVGKSSLINALMNRKALARTSAQPGKTQTINFYNINDDLYYVDLPGYGYAKRPAEDKKKWSMLTDGYFTKNPNVDLLKVVIQLVDSRIPPTPDDEMMINWMNQSGIPYIIVATKVDKLNKTERKKNLEALANHPMIAEGTPIIPFSSLKNEGKDELWREIMRRI